MKNLVIGSEGFVGRPLCRYLEQLGETVIHFDLKRSDTEDARCGSLPLTGIDRVYFLAWEVGGAKYLYREDIQLSQLQWNLALLTNILPQLHQARLPFLFISSQLAEEGETVYGVTKRLGEVWTSLIPTGVRVRLWNVYGGYEDSTERSHVVADFVHQAMSRGEIAMLTDGEEVRQFVFVEDVCRAFHRAVADGLRGVYDVTSFEWIRVREVADTIAELTGAKVIPGTRRGSTPLTPIRGRIPGWLPEVSLREGLQRMIANWETMRGSTRP